MSLLGVSKQVVEAVYQNHRDIYTFLEGVLKDAGCSTSDKGTHNEMIKMLYDHLDSFMFMVIVEHLPDKHSDAFLTIRAARPAPVPVLA
jgi:hypothetical protein